MSPGHHPWLILVAAQFVVAMAATGCTIDQSVVVPDTSPPADSATGRDAGTGRDSVYVQFTGSLVRERDLDERGGFLWNRSGPFTVPAGPTTLTISMRENGSHLDQIFISAVGSTPP